MMRQPITHVLPLLACMACSPTRAPFHYSMLSCATLRVSDPTEGRWLRSDAPAALDPALGWAEKLTGTAATCDAPAPADAKYCERVMREALRYTALQEAPLDKMGAMDAFRGLFVHSLGATVMVRVLRSEGQAVMVAKVLDEGVGPLGWMTTRRLSEAEWLSLKRAADALPDGRNEYFPEPRPQPKKASTTTGSMCFVEDGATTRIERFTNGVLHINYAQDRTHDCSATAPSREALFFQQLRGLIRCAESNDE